MNNEFFSMQQDCSEFWLQLNKLLEQEYEAKEVEGFDVLTVLSVPLSVYRVNWPHRFTTLRKLHCLVCKKDKEDRVEQHHMLSLDYSMVWDLIYLHYAFLT